VDGLKRATSVCVGEKHSLALQVGLGRCLHPLWSSVRLALISISSVPCWLSMQLGFQQVLSPQDHQSHSHIDAASLTVTSTLRQRMVAAELVVCAGASARSDGAHSGSHVPFDPRLACVSSGRGRRGRHPPARAGEVFARVGAPQAHVVAIIESSVDCLLVQGCKLIDPQQNC